MMILFNVDLKQLAINNFYLYTICFLMPLIYEDPHGYICCFEEKTYIFALVFLICCTFQLIPGIALLI